MKRLFVLPLLIVMAGALPDTASAQPLPAHTRPLSPITAVADYTSANAYANLMTARHIVYGEGDSTAPSAGSVTGTFYRFFSPLATGPKGVLCGSLAGSAYWYDPATDAFTRLISLRGQTNSLSMTVDGGTMAVATADGVFLWDKAAPARAIRLNCTAWNNGTAYASHIQLSADGKKMLVTVTISDEHESWNNQYLVDLSTMEAKQTSRGTAGYAFTPDGQHLVQHDYDYDRKDESGHAYFRYSIYDYQGKRLAWFSVPGGWSRSRGDLKKSLNEKTSPIDKWFSMGWSDFGLTILAERPDYVESGVRFNRLDVVPGRPDGPDITSYRDPGSSVSPNSTLRLSTKLSDDNQSVTVQRLGATDDEVIWQRKIAISGENRILRSSYVDESQNVLAMPISKIRPDSSGQRFANVRLIRTLDWRTGRSIMPDLALGAATALRVNHIAPGLEYMLLETERDGCPAFYWIKQGILRNWEGTMTFMGPGIQSFSATYGGGVSFSSDGKEYCLAPDPEQYGAPLRIAVHPSQRLLAIVDEAGQFFIRDLSSGRTRYRSRLTVTDARAILSDPLPDASSLGASVKSGPTISYGSQPTVAIDEKTIGLDPSFIDEH